LTRISGIIFFDGETFEMDCARVGLEKAGQQIDEGGLARAVRPDQADARAAHEINIDRLRNGERAELLSPRIESAGCVLMRRP
jgi:hypothetical protein